MSNASHTSASPDDVRARRLRGFGKALATSYTLTVVNAATYLVSVPLYLQWTGPGQFGFWLILLQLLWAASFFTSWIAAPCAREAAACQVQNDQKRLGQLVGTASLYYAAWGGLVVVMAATAGSFLGTQAGLDPEYLDEARLATGLVGVSGAVLMQLNLLLSVLTGYQRMHISNLLLASLTLLSAILGLTLVYMGWGVAGMALGHLMSAVGVAVAALLLMVRRLGLRLRLLDVDWSQLRALLTTGSGYFAYGLSYLLLQSDIVLVGMLLGVEAAAVYGVAFRAVDQIVQLVWKVPDSLFPLTAELSARGELARLRPVHRAASKAALGAALIAAGLLMFYGGPLLGLWVGEANAAGGPVLGALAAVLVSHAFVHSSVIVPYGANRMGLIPLVTMIEAALKLALALALLPEVGMAGAALATLLAQAACTVWYVPRVACRLTTDTCGEYLRAVIVPLLPALVGLLVAVAVVRVMVPAGMIEVAIGLLVVPLIYGALYAAYAVRREEWLWVRGAVAGRSAGPRGTIG